MLPVFDFLEDESRPTEFKFQRRRICCIFCLHYMHGEGVGMQCKSNEVKELGSDFPCARMARLDASDFGIYIACDMHITLSSIVNRQSAIGYVGYLRLTSAAVKVPGLLVLHYLQALLH